MSKMPVHPCTGRQLPKICIFQQPATPQRWLWIVILGIGLSVGSWYSLSGLYIQGKALVAQVLLSQAWQETLETGLPARPWWWADTWPVARMSLRGREQIVLSQASGRALAFGPAHLPSSTPPGERGHVVITGHRDTHFRGIAGLRRGDLVTLEHQRGRDHYRVSHSEIMDLREGALSYRPELDLLTLVTCYPFDALSPGTPLRYLVHLNRMESSTKRDQILAIH